MIEIILLIIKIILILFFCGYSFTSIFLHKKFSNNIIFWLSFWFGVVLLALLGIFFSMAKIPIEQAKYPILLFFCFVWLYGFYNKKIKFTFSKENIFIGILTIVIILFNLYPLIIRAGFPTTISLSNLDPVSYNMVADFFIKQTVTQGKELLSYKPYLWAVGDLVHYIYRWGSPMILSFISSLLDLRSYQVFSILLTIFFALTFPLVYILSKNLINKSKLPYLLILTFITYGINSTLLYVLYNGFFAHIIFSGIFLVILIILVDYLRNTEINTFNLNSYDLLLGICLASLAAVYPEGISFILLSWLFFTIIKLFTKDRLKYIIIFGKILLIALIINPINLGTAISWNFELLINTTKTSFIGWDRIRYASPIETIGLYNLYYSRDIPKIINLIINIPVIIILIIGLIKIKKTNFILSHIVVFGFFYFMYRLIFPNYYTFFKAITFSVFLYSILFSIGVNYFLRFSKRKIITIIILLFLFGLSFRSAYRTIFQLYHHPRIIDRSLASLEEINSNHKIIKPFYTSDVFLGEYDLWKRLWREYILMNKSIVTRQNMDQPDIKNESIDSVLVEKGFENYESKRILIKKVIWENEYYLLGEIDKEKYVEKN